jgi:hypothetical protein
MIYRIYPTKDTAITNYVLNGVSQTGSNQGASETLGVFKKAPLSGVIGPAGTASLSRMLIAFDTTILSYLTGSGQIPSSGVTYRLVLHDSQHDKTLPFSYDMEVARVTSDWDEGRGIDSDFYSDKGFANWIYRKQGLTWTGPGGDIASSSLVPFHFDQGDENLSVDVTSIVQSWMSGTVPNYGFLVRVSSSQEVDGYDYYIKKFSGRSTNFLDHRPYIEASWDDSLKDDRNNFVFDYPNRLFIYNVVRGAYSDISGVGQGQVFLRLVDASGTLLFATGSWVSTGIYSASITLPTGSYSGSVFQDIWFSGSRALLTGTIYPLGSGLDGSVPAYRNLVSVQNIRNEYTRDESVRFNLFIAQADFSPAVVHTASLDSLGTVVTKAYYQIVNDRTDEVVIPFGTGTVETTRLSYDEKGNYFKFYMGTLSPGNVYRIVFLFDQNGQRQVIDDGFKFRIA